MTGWVYVQTNDAAANAVVVYGRDGDGRLERLGSYPTGGKGSGSPHLPSQSAVTLADGRLFVTNTGSDDLSVLAIDGDALRLVDCVASGGTAPRSVAVHEGCVYVLNTGGIPNVTGFRLTGDRLEELGSTQPLGEGSDPAQVAFGPDGSALIVTDRAADAIHVLALDAGFRASAPVAHRSSGATPYGFAVRADGTLVVTEAARAEAGKASASSYRIAGDGGFVAVSGAIGNTRSEVCWAVVSKDGRTAFVTNFGDGTISSYAIGADGSIELRDAVAATTVDGQPGIRDEALTGDGRFLYALHADTGSVYGWAVAEDGTLEPVDAANGLPLTAAGLAAT